MDKKIPKLILKIEFIEDFNVDISLITLNDFYNKNIMGSKVFSAPDNDFIIYESDSFKVQDGLISLPDEDCTSINKSVIKFFSDKRRYDALKELKDALLSWSDSKYWKGNEQFEKQPSSIEYKKNLWILY